MWQSLLQYARKKNGQLLEGVLPDIGVVFLMKKYSMIYIMHRARTERWLLITAESWLIVVKMYICI